MRVALLATLNSNRKEPLSELVTRVVQAFHAAGHPAPQVRFTFSDNPLATGVSAVARALKRFPELQPFSHNAPQFGVGAPVSTISNTPGSPKENEQIPLESLQALVAGVPRSLPFHHISLHFHGPAFGEASLYPTPEGQSMAGISVHDSWWINGRNRALTAIAAVDADPNAKKLPPLPEPAAQIIAACGKVKKTQQFLIVQEETQTRQQPPTPDPQIAATVKDYTRQYLSQMPAVLARAAMPHALTPAAEVWQPPQNHEPSGEKKPSLVELFSPLGYDVRGERGVFILKRRTPTNLTLEVNIDVGTWSNAVLAGFLVHGWGFRARIGLPVEPSSPTARQYPIGGPENWRKIAENLAALVRELEASFVPGIEEIAGPTPEWWTGQTIL